MSEAVRMLELVTDVLQSVWPQEWVGRCRTLLVTLSVVYITKKILKHNRKRKLRQKWLNAGKDVVVLHQFSSGKYCPNLSPFVLKLESFLRLSNIKYVVDLTTPFGPKRKCPWITINGEDLADSQFIVEYLTQRFNVAIDAHLNPRQAAIAESLRILADEHLFWCVLTWRYWHDGCVTFFESQTFGAWTTFLFRVFMFRAVRKKARAHGIGLHTPEEVYHITKRACGTVAGVLGDDKFLGGEQPCTADCAMFGILAQLMWNAQGSRYQALLTEVYPSLARYCMSMKERVYPDWDSKLQPTTHR